MNNTFYVDMTQDRVLENTSNFHSQDFPRKLTDLKTKEKNQWHYKKGDYYFVDNISYSYQELKTLIQILSNSTDDEECSKGLELSFYYLKNCECCGAELILEENLLCNNCEKSLENTTNKSLIYNI